MRHAITFALLAIGLTGGPASAGGPYVFTNVADTNDPRFGPFITGPMNDAGQVAFFTFGGNDPAGLYLYDGTDVQLGEAILAQFTYARWGIDAVGNIYYSQVFSGPTDGIYQCSVGGPTVQIYQKQNQLDTVGPLTCNEAGDVAFDVGFDSGAFVSYEGNAVSPPGTVTVISDNSGPFDFTGSPYILDDGTHFLIGITPDIPVDLSGLYLGDATTPPNTLTTYVDSSGPYRTFGTQHAINTADMSLFQGTIDVGNQIGLFWGTPGNLQTLFMAADPEWTGIIRTLDINECGQIVFTTHLESFPDPQNDSGVFVRANDPVTDMIMGPGMPLFGATCTRAISSDFGAINQSGQITFWYRLDNGVEGIAIATPVIDCPGDLDLDGDIGILDVLLMLAGWGACPGCPGDLDGDDMIGITDLLEQLANWGPCEKPVEGCCFGDGDCSDLSITDCFLAGGTPLGPGSECIGDLDGDLTDDACTGLVEFEACCFPNGDCADYTVIDCIDSGGVLAGPGTSCSGDGDGNGIDDACEAIVATTACCLDEFTCVELTPDDCADMGGVDIGISTCFPDICIVILPGACCVDGQCVEVDDLDDCDALGGVWNGDGTECIDVDCAGLGACCVFGKCIDGVDQFLCEKKFGGVYQGDGTTCGDVICPPK